MLLRKCANRKDVPNDKGPVWQLDEEGFYNMTQNFIYAVLQGDTATAENALLVVELLDLHFDSGLIKETLETIFKIEGEGLDEIMESMESLERVL